MRPWLFSHPWIHAYILRKMVSSRLSDGNCWGGSYRSPQVAFWYVKALSLSGKSWPQEYVAICVAQVSQGYKIPPMKNGCSKAQERA